MISPVKISIILDREIRRCQALSLGVDEVIGCAMDRASRAIKALHGGEAALACLKIQSEFWRSLALGVENRSITPIDGDLRFADYVNRLKPNCGL